MIAIPAIDLREGACVQLVGGSYASERVRLPNPRGAAQRWADSGFARLHVVDLDAATGRGSNARIVRGLLRAGAATTQVGGGVRTTRRVGELLKAGARYVIVGTRAVTEPEWIREAANAHPAALIVAADVRDRAVVTHGWERTTQRDVTSLVADLSQLPLAGILVTAVHKEGQLLGADVPMMHDVAKASRVPVLASGGVTTRQDLLDLASAGVAAAVIGMALYTGVLDARRTAEEFGQ